MLETALVPVASTEVLDAVFPGLKDSERAAATARMNAAQAKAAGVAGSEQVRVHQGEASAVLALRIDERVPDGCVWIPSGTAEAAALGSAFGPIRVERA